MQACLWNWTSVTIQAIFPTHGLVSLQLYYPRVLPIELDGLEPIVRYDRRSKARRKSCSLCHSDEWFRESMWPCRMTSPKMPVWFLSKKIFKVLDKHVYLFSTTCFLPFNFCKSGVGMFLRSKDILPLTLSLFNLSECWFPLTPNSNPMNEMTTTSKMQTSGRKFLFFSIVNTEHLLQQKWTHWWA